MISNGILSQAGTVVMLRSKMKQDCNMCWLAVAAPFTELEDESSAANPNRVPSNRGICIPVGDCLITMVVTHLWGVKRSKFWVDVEKLYFKTLFKPKKELD
jgi:hypothetical protein